VKLYYIARGACTKEGRAAIVKATRATLVRLYAAGTCPRCEDLSAYWGKSKRCDDHLRGSLLERARAYFLRLDTLTGALTLVAMSLVSEKLAAGWAVGLVNQALWLMLIKRKRLWGLLPLCGTLTAVYARALWKWLE